MKPKIIHFILTLLLATSTASCFMASTAVKGPVTKQTRQVSDFTSIDAARGVTVIYTQADQRSIIVEAPESVIDRIITKVNGGELKVTIDNKISKVNFKAIVRVSSPLVTEFEASSGSSIEISSLNLPTRKLEVEISSGASVTASGLTVSAIDVEASSGSAGTLSGIKATTVKAESSSGAALTLSGAATTASYQSSSGASLAASSLTVDQADATASSGGSITCKATSMTRSKATSGGSISNN